MYLCEAGFSSYTSAKAIYCSKCKAETAKRIQLTFLKADIKEFYKTAILFIIYIFENIIFKLKNMLIMLTYNACIIVILK